MFRTLAAALTALTASAAVADDRPVLTVYTYDSFVSDWGPGPQIEAAFEQACSCDLEFVAAGDGAALLSRVRLEGPRTDADVVLGLDQHLIAQAQSSGLFAPHDLNTDGRLSLPITWENPTFLPYDWGYFAFVYDTARLAPENAPNSFDDLLNASDDVTIIIQDPRSSTPGLGLALWVQAVYGDQAEDVWARLSPRIVTVARGWWESYAAFLDGESMMVLSYDTSPAYHALAEDDETKAAAVFSDGHLLQIEVAAKVATTDQPELADAFMAFMLSPEFQSVIPTTNWMRPAATGIEIPEGFGAEIDPTTALFLAPESVGSQRRAAVDAWRDGLSR